jgi:hypothetical protein
VSRSVRWLFLLEAIMHNLFTNALLIIVIYVLIRSADIAISSAIARDLVRAIFYGIVAILSLVFVVLSLFGFI